MIRNKTLWWFFAIVVSVSFIWVYSDASKSEGGCSAKMPDAVGMLYNKEISRQTLDHAMYYTMRMRNYHNQSAENMRIIRREAWKRLAALETASQLGISATVDELVATIGRDPNFQVDGTFNKDKYRVVIESQMQAPVEQFEDFLREEIILQKLAAIMEACVWTSPVELSQRLTRITDQLIIQYAIFKIDTNPPSITIKEDDARKYFDNNIEQFRIPDRVSVKYIMFPASNHMSKIQLSPAEIRQYYTNNMDKFAVADTNSTATKPFEEVKKEIQSILLQEKALTEAKDQAARFVTTLIPDRKGKAPSFEEAAQAAGYIISTSAFFSSREDVPLMKVSREFNRAAFDLDPNDRERYFSDPVSYDDTVYVLAANSRQESHLPEFSSSVEKAKLLAQREEDEKAFLKKCNDAKNNAQKAVKAGQRFEEEMKKSGAIISTNISFSAYEAASSPFEYFDIIVPKVMHMSKGEITDPIELDDGMMIVHLVSREPGKPGAAESVRPEMITAIDRSLTIAVYDDWKEHLLLKAGFVDRSPPISTGEEDSASKEEKNTRVKK